MAETTAATSFDGFPREAFAWFAGLHADNSKRWFSAHRETYERAVREPLEALLEQLAGELGGAVKLFRQHRDTRFSADKSPYKTHQGAFCEQVGGIGFYLQLDADGLLTAGGFYAHSREQTARYRAAVDSDSAGRELEKIMKTLGRYGFEQGGDRVRTRPRGCPPDHPRLDLMRHESLTAAHRLPATAQLSTPAALDLVRADWRRLRPLVDWVLTHVGALEMA
jgi:uncharacterized protein (TIGR02453 family)